ncbi:unnamed protein product [Orchesella dallaii]|uniref:Chitin-binding type-2 domain-containing protein n=1 Tax=Orchesella dallaii TaxID=48710 RepID=A0ABP1QJ76_9HEXA
MAAPSLTSLTCLFSLIIIVTLGSANPNSLDFPQRTNQELEDYCMKTGSTEADWNPDLITDNIAFNSLCEGTIGTFPNPCNCSEFIMCVWGYTFLWTCAAPDTSYLPFASLCSYSKNSECPKWKSTWESDNVPVRCETVGQRPWDAPLLLPADPTAICDEDYIMCFNFTEIGTGTCPEGKRFSKAYFGCIDKELCEEIDTILF